MSKSMREILLAIAVFCILALLVLSPVIFDQSKDILGVDGNYSMRFARDRSIDEGATGLWLPYWLGRYAPLGVHSFVWLYRFLDPGLALPMICLVSWAVAALFTYLLLRRFGFGCTGSLFGGIAFGFTPHFATLVYPCHLTVISAPPYVAMLFYFAARFVDASKPFRESLGWAILAGVSWGMLMNEDVQRGLYFSIVAVGFMLVEAWPALRDRVAPRRWLILSPGRFGVLMVLGSVCLLFMLGVFANALKGQLGGANVQGVRGGVSEASAQASQQKWEFATSWSHHPAELIDAFVPGYHGEISGDPDTPYFGYKPVKHNSDAIGLLVIVFAIVGTAAGVREDKRVRFFAVVCVCALLLSMGEYIPGRWLFRLWYQLPMMDRFRAPVKFLSVVAFSLAVLSGCGLNKTLKSLSSGKNRLPTILLWSCAGALVLSLVALIAHAANSISFVSEISKRLGRPLAAQAQATRTVSLFWLSGLLAGLTAAFIVALRYRKYFTVVPCFGSALVLILALDLYRVDSLYLRRSLFEPNSFYQEDEMTHFLKANAGGSRTVMSLKLFHQGRMVPLPLTQARGNYVTYLAPYFNIQLMENTPQARVPGDYQGFFAALLPDLPDQRQSVQDALKQIIDGQIRFWRITSVKYVVTDGFLYGLGKQPFPVFEILRNHAGLKHVRTCRGPGGREHAILEVLDSLPIAYFFSHWRNAATPGEALSMLAEEDIDFSAEVVVEGGDAPRSVQEGVTTSADVLFLEQGEGRLLLDVNARTPGVLVVSRRFNPAWQAVVDGKPQSVRRVQGILCGLFLEAGKHRVEYRYRPDQGSRRLSETLAVAGIFLGAIWVTVFSFAQHSASRERE